MKNVKKRLYAYYEHNLLEPDDFPFEDSFPGEKKKKAWDNSETFYRCAGLVLAIGFMGLTVGLWGEPGYSPALRAMDIEGLQEKILLLSEKILTSYK